eukprot:scaffold61646_cov62-Phaeocystis_antarctica.AAC.3
MKTARWSLCLPRSSANGCAPPPRPGGVRVARVSLARSLWYRRSALVSVKTLLTSVVVLAADHREAAAHHPAAGCSHRPSQRSTSGPEAAEDDHDRARDE